MPRPATPCPCHRSPRWKYPQQVLQEETPPGWKLKYVYPFSRRGPSNKSTVVFVGLKEYQGRWLIFSGWLLQGGLSLIVHAAWLQSLELRFPQVQEGILTHKVKAPRIVLGRQEHPARTELFPTKLTCRVRAKAAYVFGRH